MTTTTSISAFNYNTITVSDIVSTAIDEKALKELDTRADKKGDMVNSIANEKKGTYAVVDVKLMDYFVNAYNTVRNLSNKTAWAEREVICATMDSEYYKRAFGSDAAYAKEIGVSTGNLSKIKNSIAVRDDLERITSMTGFGTALVDELISPYNKTKDDFKRFVLYSDITPATTVKYARESFKKYQDIVARKARPVRKGFFFDKDGNDVETESEYNKRIEAEREKLEAELKAKAQTEESKPEEPEEQKTEESKPEEQETEESKPEESEQEENPFWSNDVFEETEEQKPEEPKTEEQKAEDEYAIKFTNAVNKLSETTKNMTITWNATKRGSKAQTVNVDEKTAKAVFALLLSSGIISM